MAGKPIRQLQFDQLPVSVYKDTEDIGEAAAEIATATIGEAIAKRGIANIIVGSQLTFLQCMRETPGIEWPAVNIFSMDAYLGLTPGHHAGFPLFLRQALIDHVPVGAFYPVPGNPSDVALACQGYELLLKAHPVDLCVLGIGENGHIAYNEPGVADFADPVWVKALKLDDVSRRQQVGEGHFRSLAEVPTDAITLTVPALRSAKRIVCLVPEKRKAEPVRRTLLGPISTDCPASILRQTPYARLFLDPESASLLPSG
jgi:glucosamine-6-phosphate deaminase